MSDQEGARSVKATGGNPPKEKRPEGKKPPKVKKPPAYRYSYDPKTGLYSMDGASLTQWLMDVEGRAKLEKGLETALDIIERNFGDATACEKAKELRKLLERKP
jgi:hypothetical protein